jgi:hypothetical protein
MDTKHCSMLTGSLPNPALMEPKEKKTKFSKYSSIIPLPDQIYSGTIDLWMRLKWWFAETYIWKIQKVNMRLV